jgi:hypothetical protein
MKVLQLLSVLDIEAGFKNYKIRIMSGHAGFDLLYKNTNDSELLSDEEVTNADVNNLKVHDDGSITIICK